METECPAKKMKLKHELENESELRQFQILDELGEEASDSDDEGMLKLRSKSENEEDESQSDLEEEDIENLLDAGLPEELRQKKKQCQYEERSKIVLEEKGRNHFEVLPEGWVQVTHNSGIPLYLHKASRVCCSSRPYFLGPGSVRKHEIPLSSIPCLNYSKALQKEAEANTKVKAEPPQESNEASNGHELRPLSNAKIETVKENLKGTIPDRESSNRTIKVRRFKSWSARRKFTKNKKQIKNLQRPTLPDGTKLITFPVLNTEGENSGAVRTKKEWIMNPNGKRSKSENEEDESQSDLEEEDIENLLDAGLPEELRQKKKQCQYEERSKIVLEEKGRNHFEVLPEGWVQVTHNSGIPLYLHKASRVCCSSRPYFLGPGSVRKHEIPLSSIPCLNYSKALQKEAEANTKVKAEPPQESNEASNGHELRPLSNAKIETVKENLKAQSLTASQVTEYCMKLFHFKTIKVRRFKSWSARRKFTKNKKQIKNLQRPTLPDGTKLITFPVLNTEGENSGAVRTKKEWIMNPNGKSYVCILHEYVQHALKKQPSYEFKELENAATPYSATVSINELKYGTGYGTSKKQAKSEAARETLEILIPQMKDKITGEKVASTQASRNSYHDLSVFDEIKIEDPRVAEFVPRQPNHLLMRFFLRVCGEISAWVMYTFSTKLTM
uniref:DRBM domain-containing protein n=1 Tax=Lutzomyia longipalpis TaxID=7200 RepID=A0A1B0CKG4_LUTLO